MIFNERSQIGTGFGKFVRFAEKSKAVFRFIIKEK
jgi:hypothetical protein